ncbi:uncharacterized protein LOC110855339 isoform X2 [Folsomia candida]|uniref:uncharacterized protein LOC110855339 isoform X2 n=1 Tax=Folsomia candida TaxID=158441 RepID=UPI000B904870|nr:uncharacterized protein LOC110855339 isoform X2 [Folsomia candida]
MAQIGAFVTMVVLLVGLVSLGIAQDEAGSVGVGGGTWVDGPTSEDEYVDELLAAQAALEYGKRGDFPLYYRGGRGNVFPPRISRGNIYPARVGRARGGSTSRQNSRGKSVLRVLGKK